MTRSSVGSATCSIVMLSVSRSVMVVGGVVGKEIRVACLIAISQHGFALVAVRCSKRSGDFMSVDRTKYRFWPAICVAIWITHGDYLPNVLTEFAVSISRKISLTWYLALMLVILYHLHTHTLSSLLRNNKKSPDVLPAIYWIKAQLFT